MTVGDVQKRTRTLALLSCVFAFVAANGCDSEPEPIDPPGPEEPEWLPPYSPCEENGFSCGGLDDEVMERSKELDALIERELASAASLEEIVDLVNEDEELNATLTDGNALMWWAEGGIPRIRWTRSMPTSPVPDEIATPAEVSEMLSLDAPRTRDSGLAVRAQGLSAHGTRKGFARNQKKVLILSPYYYGGELWAKETDAIESAFKADPQYRETVLVLRGRQVTPTAFRFFKEFDVVHVVSHGTQTLETAIGSKRISALLTRQVLNTAKPEPGRVYTRSEAQAELVGKCDGLDEMIAAKSGSADLSLYKGIACALVPMTYPGVAMPLDTPVIAITSEYLANPLFQSAPLVDTFVHFSACSTGKNLGLSGFDLFMSEGSTLMAYDDEVSEVFAKDTAIEFYEDMLKYNYDTAHIFDVQSLGDLSDSDYKGASPLLYSSDNSSIRLKEVVVLKPDGNADLEGEARPTVVILPSTVDGERFDRVDLDVELRGAHLLEGDLLSDYQVGVFLADERGEPVGSVLEPGWLSPGERDDGSMRVDDATATWSVFFDDVVLPVDLAEEPTVQISIQARLLEGGISQTSYELHARDPSCPSATLAVDGGPKELTANEVTVQGFGPLWVINVGRAEFDSEGNQTERIHPTATVTLSGVDFENLGTEWTRVVMDEDSGNSGVVTYDDTAYYLAGELELEDGSTFEAATTISVRRLPGTRRVVGKIEGVTLASDGMATRPNVGLTLDFISDDINEGEPRTNCYFYTD